MRNRYDSPLCSRGCGLVETPVHKISLCTSVSSTWNKLLDLVIYLEPVLVFESSYDILHLNFPETKSDNTILWLLGQYLDYIEDESIIKQNKVNASHFQGYISAKLIDSAHVAMPEIYAIPCLNPTGVG